MIGGALLVIAFIIFIIHWLILMFSLGTSYTPGPLLYKISLALGVLGAILLFIGI